jgi:hypothetical protein
VERIVSNAVEPSRTATTATRPRPGARTSRFSSGFRTTMRPSPRRPSTDSRPTKPEKTSKASPRSNQVEPNSRAATRCTPAYSMNQVRIETVLSGVSEHSSRYTNANRPIAAGQ